MNTDLPPVSIVVPVYNGEANIAACIESLLALDYPEEKREIIIVDNNSRDRTPEIVEKYPVRLLKEKKQGACCARNSGIREARFPLIAFTDSDCIAGKSWLKQMVACFQDEKTGGCGGRLEPVPPKTMIEEYTIYKDILSQERALQDEPISPPFVITANAMFRKRVLEEAGGFDESFTIAGEDADLCWRIGWMGYRIGYAPLAVVKHNHRTTLRGLLRQIRSYGRGASQLFRKHHERLGYGGFFVSRPYREILFSIVKIPFALVLGKDKFHRVLPILDFLGAISFLAGKLPASLKYRIKYL